MKKGFTLVELLAVIVILALLLVLVIPGFTRVFGDVKRNNLQSKIREVESMSLKYGAKIKDEIKENNYQDIEIKTLIQNGYLSSDSKSENVIISPTDNLPLSGKIRLVYCNKKLDIEAHYYENLEKNKIYYKDDVILKDSNLYICKKNYKHEVDNFDDSFTRLDC